MVIALPLVFEAFLVALAAFLLLRAIDPNFAQPIIAWIKAQPAPLSLVGDGLDYIWTSLKNSWSLWTNQAGNDALGPLVKPVEAVTAVTGETAETINRTIGAVTVAPATAINYVQANDLPPIYNQIGATQSEVSSLQDWSTLEFGQAFTQISANHTETRSWVDNLSQNVQAFNDWVIGQLQAHSATEANNHAESRSWVNALAAQVQAFNTWTVEQLQSQAASIGYVESEANQWAAAAQTNAEGYADVAAAAAETAAVGFVTSTVVPQVNATAAALTSYLDTCGTPLCGGMLNSANLLNELKNIVGTGAMLLFVAEAIDRPVETAQAVDSLVGPLAHTVYAGIRDVTGL